MRQFYCHTKHKTVAHRKISEPGRALSFGLPLCGRQAKKLYDGFWHVISPNYACNTVPNIIWTVSLLQDDKKYSNNIENNGT